MVKLALVVEPSDDGVGGGVGKTAGVSSGESDETIFTPG